MPHSSTSPAPSGRSTTAPARDRPLNELLSRDMVDIYVGSENTHWIIHEKLLCARSAFFRSIFYTKGSAARNTAFGLPDEDDQPFRLFIGWLYGGSVPVPREENDLGDLFELYLMGEKWAIHALVTDALDAVRRFYLDTQTYPGLRRVQYVYANTKDGSPMRELLVGSVARMLVVREEKGMPQHWDKALRKNGQLAVDIILAVQGWKIEADKVPDPRVGSVEPIVEKAIEKGVVKKEEDLQLENGELPDGVKEVNGDKLNGDSEEPEQALTNGVNGVHLDDDEEEEEEDEEEEQEDDE